MLWCCADGSRLATRHPNALFEEAYSCVRPSVRDRVAMYGVNRIVLHIALYRVKECCLLDHKPTMHNAIVNVLSEQLAALTCVHSGE
jgi:hypothetical protein